MPASHSVVRAAPIGDAHGRASKCAGVGDIQSAAVNADQTPSSKPCALRRRLNPLLLFSSATSRALPSLLTSHAPFVAA